MLLRIVVSAFSLAQMVLAVGAVSGQDYPNKPIRIATSNVGGNTDFAARQIAQGISGPLGQPVVVENRGTIVAVQTAAKATPDGYTLLFQSNSLWNTPLVQKMPYDPVKDFLPISLTNKQTYILFVHPSLPVKSVKELIALAKARPGEVNYSSSPSAGAASTIAGELFKTMAGINIVRISYKEGSGSSINDLLSGEVQMTFDLAVVLAPHVKSGRLKALAVTSAEPSPLFPGLPTMAASGGLLGYESVGMTGMFAPAKTPEAIIKRLNQEIVRVLNQPDVKQKFFDTGVETVGSSPEQFAAAIKTDMEKMGQVIKSLGIRTDF